MKKTTKGLLSALLLTAMCGTVGCKPEASSTGNPSTGTQISSTSSQQVTVEAQNLLSSIVDSGDGCYTVTEADGKTTVAFNKPAGKEWSSAKVDLTGMTNKDKMSTLRFKVSGVGKLVLKFEGSAGTAQVEIFIYESASKYEWSLLDDVAKITDAHSLFIFAAGGGAGEGSVIFEELTLTPNVAGDDTSYQIITTNYKNFIDGPHVYDGISDEFHFSWDWACGDGDVYEFTYGDNGIKVDYAKPEQNREWAAALTPVAGDFSKMNYLNFRVTGTQGKAFTGKVAQAKKENNVAGFSDGHFTFSGKEDTFSIDMSNLTPEAKRTIGNVLFFAEGGAYGPTVEGSFMLHDAWFSKEMPDTAKVNKYLDGADFNANKYWKYDSCFSATEVNGKTTISWENVEDQERWKAAWTDFEGNVSCFGELEYSITVKAKTAVRIEIPGCGLLGDLLNLGDEAEKTFTGSFDLSKFTKEQLSNAKQIRVYPRMAINDSANVEAGEQKDYDVPATGSIEIDKFLFVGGKTNVDAETGAVDVKTAGWVGNYCTYEAVEDGVKINYTRGHTDWSGYRFRINKDSLTGKNYTKVVVEFTGTEGKGGVFKLETEGEYSGIEEKYLNESWNEKDRGFFTGEKQTLEIDITTLKADKDIRFIVFAAPTAESGGAEAGSLVINSITFVA